VRYRLLVLLLSLAWPALADSIYNPGSYPVLPITPRDILVPRDSSGSGLVDSGIGTLSGRITGLADPVNPQDAATRSYVTSIATSLVEHAGARVATTAALTVTYANGTAGVGATLTNAGTQAAISIDGVALSAADRVLIKDQASQVQNGIYAVTTVGNGSTNWVLTRSTDFDQPLSAELAAGAYLSVSAGTANASTLWIESCIGPFTIGTTPICFEKIGNTYNADGMTLQLSGNVFSLITPVTVPSGGSGAVTFTSHAPLLGEGTGPIVATAALTNGQLLVGQTGADPLPKTLSGDCTLAASGAITCPAALGGTVTSVGLTVPAASILGVTGSPVTSSGALGLTTAGTSGGVPYFGSASTLSSSALLAANQIMLGGGAGIAPATLGSLGTSTIVLHGNASGPPSFGAVANADLVNSATTVNGQTCTLGSACTVTAAATGITVGTTTVGAGTDGRLLYDNSGVLGELAPTTTLGTSTLTLGGTTTTVNGLTIGTSTLGSGRSYSGATDTVGQTDCGVTVTSTGASAVTETLPDSTTGECHIVLMQGGAGQVSFTASGTATLHGAHSYTKTFGQYSKVEVYHTSGAPTVWYLNGDGSI